MCESRAFGYIVVVLNTDSKKTNNTDLVLMDEHVANGMSLALCPTLSKKGTKQHQQTKQSLCNCPYSLLIFVSVFISFLFSIFFVVE